MTAESAVSAARRAAWTASNTETTPRWVAEEAANAAGEVLLSYVIGVAEMDGPEAALLIVEDLVDELLST